MKHSNDPIPAATERSVATQTRYAGAEAAVHVYRGEGLDAIHYASVAVVDGRGQLIRHLGDPDLVVMARSAIKPFQLMALLTSGAADHFGFSPKQLAVMCGSHGGTDAHREVVLSNLRQSGHTPDDLQCGTHWPLWMQVDVVHPANGEDKDPLRHNCSGKHSGFLSLAKFLGDDKQSYLDPDSAAQRLVKQKVAECCSYPVERISTSIDGCSAPNFPLPLKHLALGFMRLAGGSVDGSLGEALSRVRAAMTAHPEMVSGEKRLDLALMRSFPGNLVSKGGAESIEGIGLADPPLGIAVKIHDGNNRALGPVCVAVLKQLGLVPDISKFPYLQALEMPEVRNYRRTVTGRIVADFQLHEA
ncbi:MAG TPA: asparaginase [Candidatus Deferrimicrobium sp.]|nr:asparaginase [Candidatus Deferrimicrobium sp.]